MAPHSAQCIGNSSPTSENYCPCGAGLLKSTSYCQHTSFLDLQWTTNAKKGLNTLIFHLLQIVLPIYPAEKRKRLKNTSKIHGACGLSDFPEMKKSIKRHFITHD